MNVLVTSSRFPHALGEIRKLGEQGHRVYASDTFRSAPGSHSRYVAQRFVTASPALDTARFLDDLEAIIRSRNIELVLPSFEEAMYIAAELPRFARLTHVFCSPLPILARLHDKFAFAALARDLDVAMPETRLARSDAELRAAIRDFAEYIARPSFSRGGTVLLTNAGPLAGRVPLEACRPTAEHPWIVQEFVHGCDVCSFSVAQHGRIVAHCAYEHPKTINHAGGILFESIDEPGTLRVAAELAGALGYHGQISFDFMRTSHGLVVIECNPRPTAGLLMMSSSQLSNALVDSRPRPPYVVPPGVREQIAIAIVRDMIHNWRDIPGDLEVLFSGIEDVYARRGDAMPMLWCLLAYQHVLAYRRHIGRASSHPSDLVAAQFFDVAWNGDAAWNANVARERDRNAAAGSRAQAGAE